MAYFAVSSLPHSRWSDENIFWLNTYQEAGSRFVHNQTRNKTNQRSVTWMDRPRYGWTRWLPSAILGGWHVETDPTYWWIFFCVISSSAVIADLEAVIPPTVLGNYLTKIQPNNWCRKIEAESVNFPASWSWSAVDLWQHGEIDWSLLKTCWSCCWTMTGAPVLWRTS